MMPLVWLGILNGGCEIQLLPIGLLQVLVIVARLSYNNWELNWLCYLNTTTFGIRLTALHLDCPRWCIGEVEVVAELEAKGSLAHGSIDWVIIFRDFTLAVVEVMYSSLQALSKLRGLCSSQSSRRACKSVLSSHNSAKPSWCRLICMPPCVNTLANCVPWWKAQGSNMPPSLRKCKHEEIEELKEVGVARKYKSFSLGYSATCPLAHCLHCKMSNLGSHASLVHA